MSTISVVITNEKHLPYIHTINDEIDDAVKKRGTGIARRTDEYLAKKISQGRAIIALDGDKFAGFCYIESWGHEKFVVNSGLIIAPAYRGRGLAKRIKKLSFDLSRTLFPHAKLFGLTTSEQVMHINTILGYVPVPFSKLTDDEQFWAGCKSCVNYDILQRTNKTKCLCTGMIFDPEKQTLPAKYKIAIAGAAGYTAGELIRILLQHPAVELVYLQSESHKGEAVAKVHRDLLHTDLVFQDIDFEHTDVLFLCMGHGKSEAFLSKHNIPERVKIIDLSTDFRPVSNTRNFLYGLPELQRARISKQSRVANPGCFATAITLGLLPLASASLLPHEISVFGITGSTGAGQTPTPETHYSQREGNLSNYKVFTHQHLHEITETLQIALGKNPTSTPDFDLAFVPVRGCHTRGIIANIVFRSEQNVDDLRALYKSFYASHPFVKISDTPLFLKQVSNTNYCYIHIASEGNKILITSMIDNLLKGASGQAVQNMNLMLGLDEKTALQLKSNYF